MTEPKDGGQTKLSDIIAANVRPWNGFWAWRDKPIAESNASREILQAAGMMVSDLRSRERGQDPPDCEATLDGQRSGIEVTELVHEKTLKRSIEAVRDRAAGKHPKQAEAYFVWEKQDLIDVLQQEITEKDRATLKGGPYERYVLVIHTDEFFLDSDTVARFLERAQFQAGMITDVVLGLSYEPKISGYPTFHLALCQPSEQFACGGKNEQ